MDDDLALVPPRLANLGGGPKPFCLLCARRQAWNLRTLVDNTLAAAGRCEVTSFTSVTVPCVRCGDEERDEGWRVCLDIEVRVLAKDSAAQFSLAACF